MVADSPPVARVQLAQYRGDMRLAASLLKGLSTDDWEDGGPGAPDSEAMRDYALQMRDFGPTLELLEDAYSVRERGLPMWRRGLALVYAHVLKLAGQVDRGTQLAQSILVLLDTNSVGRAPDWFCRERASAFAILGEDDLALEQLEISVRSGKLYRWWYLAERDPLFEHLRGNPRFKALNDAAHRRIEQQRQSFAQKKRGSTAPAPAGAPSTAAAAL
jgi:hypothetical protein